jgi:hypothetical protein
MGLGGDVGDQEVISAGGASPLQEAGLEARTTDRSTQREEGEWRRVVCSPPSARTLLHEHLASRCAPCLAAARTVSCERTRWDISILFTHHPNPPPLLSTNLNDLSTMKLVLLLLPTALAGPLAYAACQTACNAGWVTCVAAVGAVAGGSMTCRADDRYRYCRRWRSRRRYCLLGRPGHQHGGVYAPPHRSHGLRGLSAQ